MGNFLNMNPADYDKPIYRVMPEDYIYSMFNSGQNVLAKPEKWDDPFENFILKSRVRLNSGEIGSFGFAGDIYGQCWTTKAASDAMWRIYSGGKRGIRIKSTVRRLLNALNDWAGNWGPQGCWIGRVRYMTDKQLIEFGNTIFVHGLSPEKIMQTFLVKRNAFNHEKEIRLLYLSEQKLNPDALFRFSVDPNLLIDNMMVDPRLTKSEAANFISEIKRKTGFSKRILRSLLYRPPENLVFPLGS